MFFLNILEIILCLPIKTYKIHAVTYLSILHRSIEHLGFSESDVCRLLAKRVFGKSDDYTRWHLVENKKDLPLPSVQMLSVIFLKGNDCIPIRHKDSLALS